MVLPPRQRSEHGLSGRALDRTRRKPTFDVFEYRRSSWRARFGLLHSNEARHLTVFLGGISRSVYPRRPSDTRYGNARRLPKSIMGDCEGIPHNLPLNKQGKAEKHRRQRARDQAFGLASLLQAYRCRPHRKHQSRFGRSQRPQCSHKAEIWSRHLLPQRAGQGAMSDALLLLLLRQRKGLRFPSRERVMRCVVGRNGQCCLSGCAVQ
jgi:hypothetical protein